MAAPRTPITMTMTAEPGRAAAALYRLLAWLSPSFPVGAFSYSHGLDAAAAAGMVHDRASLEGWIAAIVARGSGRIAADILCEAYRAARAGDEAGIDIANRRGLAFRATAELALEAGQQGEAFLAAWPAALGAPPGRGEGGCCAGAGVDPSPRERRDGGCGAGFAERPLSPLAGRGTG